MAGLFYLPRLFVYHTQVQKTDATYAIFLTMERKLLRFIMTPAMILTFLFGILLIWELGGMSALTGAFHAKFLLVFLMAGFQGYLGRCYKTFLHQDNHKTEKFYRMINEVPTVLLIGIVFLVVFKPF